jgi:hypothetical protein
MIMLPNGRGFGRSHADGFPYAFAYGNGAGDLYLTGSGFISGVGFLGDRGFATYAYCLTLRKIEKEHD